MPIISAGFECFFSAHFQHGKKLSDPGITKLNSWNTIGLTTRISKITPIRD
jgi:hypothetical protein